MFCNRCGKEIDNGAIFCKYCGAKVQQEPNVSDLPEKPVNNHNKRLKSFSSGKGGGKALLVTMIAGGTCVMAVLVIALTFCRKLYGIGYGFKSM